MEMYIEQGLSRMECELKIAEKYKRPFHILSEKEIRIGGFMGLFSRQGVQVEFYFTPMHYRKTDAFLRPPGLTETPDTEYRQRLNSQLPDLESEKRKVLAAAGKKYEEITAGGREASQQILDTLKELKEKIDSGAIQGLPAASGRLNEHPALKRAVELLKANDFSENYINGMIEKLRKEMSLEKLDNIDIVEERLLELIGESINIYEESNIRKPRIMVLVGPTGVGKTTTIAKLAAIMRHGKMVATTRISSLNFYGNV